MRPIHASGPPPTIARRSARPNCSRNVAIAVLLLDVPKASYDLHPRAGIARMMLRRARARPKEENAMKLVAGVAAVVLAFTLAAPAPAQQPASAPTLYKRLGGYDAMAAVTDDFCAG